MKTHNMKLYSEPFELVREGKKNIEVRLNDEKRREIEINDEIIFTHYENPNEQIKVKVVGLSKFNSFRELYSTFPKSKFGHNEKITLEEQIRNVREIYSEEKEKKYGVLGIHIQLIK